MPLAIKYFSPDAQVFNDASTSINTLRISGTSNPDTTVYLYDGAKLIGSAIAAASGSWQFETGSLSDGEHLFSAMICDVNDNPLEYSDAVRINVVPSITNFTKVNDKFFQIDALDYQVQSGGQSWSITSPDSHTTRFQVSSGDFWAWDSKGRERSEIAGSTRYDAGEIVTVKYDFMVEPGPKNTAVGPGKWLAIGQFHAIALDGFPPFDVELVGERLAFNVSYQEPGAKSPNNDNYIFIDDKDIVRGKYYDMKIQTNLQNDKGGFLKVWVDGELIVNYSGPIGFGTPCYWKQGIYRTAAPETVAVNFKNLSISEGNGELAAAVVGESQVFVGTASRDVHEGIETTQIGNAGSDELAAARQGADYKIIGGKGNDNLTGLDGRDKLIGGKGGDDLSAGSGNDILSGGKGADSFSFVGAFGTDVVKDFQVNRDQVLFFDTPFKSFDDLRQHMSKQGNGTLITVDSDTSLLLANAKLAKLDAHDFLFA